MENKRSLFGEIVGFSHSLAGQHSRWKLGLRTHSARTQHGYTAQIHGTGHSSFFMVLKYQSTTACNTLVSKDGLKLVPLHPIMIQGC